MTGQVKEVILTCFGELGLLVKDRKISFKPSLLKATEFLSAPDQFSFIDITGDQQAIALTDRSLGFTYCQVPFIYTNNESRVVKVEVTLKNGETIPRELLELSAQLSTQVFSRCGDIKQVQVSISEKCY